MKRRDFIKKMTALGMTGIVPLSAIANLKSGMQLVNTKQLFNDALSSDASLIGFSNTEKDFPRCNLEIEGVIPSDLKGSFVRNGPARHARGNIRYRHLFEGDGMIQKFTFDEGKLQHFGRFVRTPKFEKEEAAGRFLYSGPDTKIADSLPVPSADHINAANTNVIAVNEELWALWEGGSASALDSNNLAFKHFVNLGDGSKMHNKLAGLPFSAHPKIEANGDIWNFGLSPSGHIVIYHLSPKGKIKNIQLLPTKYKGGMLHDFLITNTHILLILPSLVRRTDEHGLFSGIAMDKQLSMQVLVVDKNNLHVERRYELPPGFAFHFGNAWQDKQGHIHFDASLYQDVGILHELSDIMSGKKVDTPTHGYTHLFSLHKNGRVSQTKYDDISEFPRVCSHLTGQQNRYLFHLSNDADSFWNNAVVVRDLKSETRARFNYGQEYLVEEHIPVCPKGIEDGYVIGSALHVPTKRTCLNVFSMKHIEDGPMARAWLPYHLPLGFHGNFISA
ncbi:carotenoid oxygenase family protein [Agaribacter flavus]|uniref:Carotenoid oxygenase family protein n=1 Tax=Agaribacter flavus TaxID=1902781 RepID=A0ABV7FVA5_9ALTE